MPPGRRVTGAFSNLWGTFASRIWPKHETPMPFLVRECVLCVVWRGRKAHIRHMLDAAETPDYSSAHIPHRRQAALAAARPLRNDSHVMALRIDRKDTPDRQPGEPLEPQDQAAVSAQLAQCHAIVGRA